MQVIETTFITIVELPGGANKNVSAQLPGPATGAFCLASKGYHLHVQKVPDTASIALVDAQGVSHYGGHPYAALYGGVFLEEAALRTYVSFFEAEHGSPDSADVREPNLRELQSRAAYGLKAGGRPRRHVLGCR